MPHPKGGYYLNGRRIPSTTTILNRLDDQSGLIFAAVKLTREGRDYAKEWSGSARIGTAVHSMVEKYLNGEKLSTDPKDWELTEDQFGQAKVAFKAFYHWNKSHSLSKPEQELSLVSSKHGFGGTFDCLYQSDKGHIVCDWKTSKHTDVSHMCQLASYGILVEENIGNVVGYYSLRLDKLTGDFHHHYWPELEKEKRAFLLMLEVYNILKESEKRLK